MRVQPLVPGELVVELRPRLRVAVRRVERGDQHAARPPPRCSAPGCRRDRPAARRASAPARRRARGSRRRSRSAARARPRRSRPPRARRAGTAASVAFSSCRQTTSGCAAASQSSRFAEPLADVVDVEGRDPHRLSRRSARPRPRPPRAIVARWSAAVKPDTALRGLRSWSPSSSHRISIAVRERVARDLLARAERVARALADQRRRRERGEVRGAQLLGPARRMERIAEAEQPGDPAGGVQLVRDHAGDPPAHRLAADDQRPRRAELRRRRRDTRASASRRAAAACGTPRPPARHVAELEARHAQPRRRQRPRRRGHRGASPSARRRRAPAAPSPRAVLGAVEEEAGISRRSARRPRSTNRMPRAAVRAHSESLSSSR